MKVPKGSVNYRKATVAGKSCSSCDMFKVSSETPECNTCTLVQGCIMRTTVCDKWEPK